MHLINFKDLNGQQLIEIIDKGIEVKHNPEKYRKALDGKSLAVIFQKTSTRTKVSFEVAMTQPQKENGALGNPHERIAVQEQGDPLGLCVLPLPLCALPPLPGSSVQAPIVL